ncbi:hypothetical protein NDI37_06980 [Funiculus sociatus GB2-A5]|jgi:plasmid maintenance system antidote protein VapI|uniref:Uncharacterized protein n=1 Tax=Funiculus sociatus GB2-A5 TaxID=2933946 RepID=A0ABV0JL92_9CYAN|nr:MULTISPECIES: hypothetical protein [unclassified Trichocoleus]MBD1833910.1 hypothetical protein [Cyanobacteria bacterium FACHB-472]MBD1908248.1 hypothetical protein [Trichocoleus sp. FACHB-832]MBD1934224.1 hypothetical protein [Trichocoleus sp. FACHB-69]MBD2006267.1 hypothetical protein [Trichocoleus sp. FACHB-40]MBD2065491.1 hypothetical protein [Trichocoleus sp. FACHB-6]
MKYTFEILGVSPVLYFFNHQQEIIQKDPSIGVEYLGTPKCTLDAFLESVEVVPPKRGWDLEEVLNTVVDFWVNNSENIQYWNKRLKDAGRENLLVARVADFNSLKAEFESLFGEI